MASVQDEVETYLAPVAALARAKLDPAEAEQLLDFLPRYYAHVSPADLAAREPRDLLGAALAHLRLGARREPATPNVAVFNPELSSHGWSSPHTVVQIVTDDMPFLVDSVRMAVTATGLGIHLVVHPLLDVERDECGVLEGWDDGSANEAWMYLEVDRCGNEYRTELERRLREALDDVRVAVDDWRPMRETALELAHDLEHSPPPGRGREAAGAAELLRWMVDDHFIFLGYRAYDFVVDADGHDVVAPVAGTGLGVLRDGRRSDEPHRFDEISPEARAKAFEPSVLVITNANSRSTVHRADYLQYVAVKCFDGDGRVIGERRFLGLFPDFVSRQSVLDMPVVRERALEVLDRAGYPESSHSGRALRMILETFPRDEIFQTSTDALYETAMGILGLQDRRQVRLFARRDDFGRFVSCFVFLPRDRFSSTRAEAMVAELEEALGGTSSEYESNVGTGALARLFVKVHAPPEASHLALDVGDLERRLAALARDWSDDLRDVLVARHGEDAGLTAFERYEPGFPPAYRDVYEPSTAADDIERIRRLDAGAEMVTALEHPLGAAPGELRFVLLRPGAPVTLTEVLPRLEDLGAEVVDERPFEITRAGRPSVWRYDIGVRVPASAYLESPQVRAEFCATFEALARQEIESDRLNRLVLAAGLASREVAILRAYARYLRQIGLPYSERYVETTVGKHPGIARDLVRLFALRFDPAAGTDRAERIARTSSVLTGALDAVPALDEDRILRSFLRLVEATTRTNAYRPAGDQPAGGHRPVLSFKLDPSAVPDMPRPRPMFEIWIYSPRLEGVHLRGGPVARGGLRWSDRPEDFRTEILGLMKAQMVKNAVIVPVGAKGGFVVKRRDDLPDPGALRAEVEVCYRQFIAGLLDVTDNVVGGEVVPPPSVVRHDGDDPYLVVAADKGTATFSDLANAVSAEYGFWLGDAFASGGSAGYDHKAMGITARGAWESVRRHARVLGLDADRDELTVVGIGDMSGDVFGNGMLLSPHLRLVGAFDHRHLFVDPNPNPAVSFAERQRLFALPRSSWADYDASLISAGGGIWPRAAKSIPLSGELRELLDVEATSLPPNELISALLRAPVDLLWNGGIGTFVKATDESHAEVEDRTNDGIRVDAAELRCRMVGEGGNLGFTQLARIEYALAGGLIFSDAIDNSAGVDCSDHEVNIKILLDTKVASGDLTVKQRNELLASMTDPVAELCLEDNQAQTLALTIARVQAGPMVDVHSRYLRQLEVEHLIDRQLEFLPSDKEFAERRTAGGGLTTPEFAVLLAYTKNANIAELMRSDLPEDPYVQWALVDYFPLALRERMADSMASHRLRREIVGTVLTNNMVNRAGITFDHRMTEETGATVPDITRAHVVAGDVFDLPMWWETIDDLGSTIDIDVEIDLLLTLRATVERSVLWLLRHRRPPLDMAATVEAFQSGVEGLAPQMAAVVRGPLGERVEEAKQRWVAQGVPEEIAVRAAIWPLLHTGFDIVEVANARGRSPIDTATVYWGLFDRLHVGWLWERIGLLPRADRWQSHARAALRDDLLGTLRELADDALRSGDVFTSPDDLVALWTGDNDRTVQQVREVFRTIRNGGTFDLTTLSVAVRQLRNAVLAARPSGR